MSAVVTPLGKLTANAQHKAEIEEMLANVNKIVAEGETRTVMVVMIRADRKFRMMKAGEQRRIETVGMLEQLKFDLLMGENPIDPLEQG